LPRDKGTVSRIFVHKLNWINEFLTRSVWRCICQASPSAAEKEKPTPAVPQMATWEWLQKRVRPLDPNKVKYQMVTTSKSSSLCLQTQVHTVIITSWFSLAHILGEHLATSWNHSTPPPYQQKTTTWLSHLFYLVLLYHESAWSGGLCVSLYLQTCHMYSWTMCVLVAPRPFPLFMLSGC